MVFPVAASFSKAPTISAVGTYIGPSSANAGETNIGMLNITINNTGGEDTINWVNVTVWNASNVASVTIWNETNGNGTFDAGSGDTFVNAVNVTYQSGSVGYFNLTNLNLGVGNTSNITFYIALNVTGSPNHGDFVKAYIEPYQINMTNAGLGNSTAIDPDDGLIIDTEKPTIEAVFIQDPDGDGNVENVTIMLSEPLQDATIDPSKFTIGGQPCVSVNIDPPPTNHWIHLNVSTDIVGTDVKEFTFTSSPGVALDLAGNSLDSYGNDDIKEVDDADPVLLSAVTNDTNKNGKIDFYKLTFSEDLYVYPGFYNDIQVAGYTVDPANSEYLGNGIIDLELNEGMSYDTGDTPEVTIPVNTFSMTDKGWVYPTHIDSGDLNGDKLPDLATYSIVTGGVIVDIYGTDGVHTSYHFEDDIRAGKIAVGDVNMDGHNDVICTDYNNEKLYFYNYSTAQGKLVASGYIGTNDGPWDVVIGDFNNDRANDIVVVCKDSNQIQTFYLNYNSMTHSTSTYATSTNPSMITKGDFNNDRLEDVVVIAGTNNLNLFIQSGGSFNAKIDKGADASPYDIVTGDFNADFLDDVAVTCTDDNNVTVWQQSGGSLNTRIDYSTEINPMGLAVGDFNIDGRHDLAITSGQNQSVIVHLQSITGSLDNTKKYNVSGSPDFATACDLKNDGKLDIIFTEPDESRFSVLTPVFGMSKLNNRIDLRTQTGTPYPRGVIIGDLNNDTYNDVVVCNNNQNSVTIFYMGPNAIVKETENIATDSYPWEADVGDINGDGLNDLVVTAQSSNRLSIFYQNATGHLDPKTYVTTLSSPRGLDIGDVNNDGLNDIVFTQYSSHRLSVFTQKIDGTLNPRVDYVSGASPWDCKIGDLNNDGRMDVVTSDWSDYTISVFIQNTGGTFNSRITYSTTDNSRGVDVGDFNNDGLTDVALAVTDDDYLTIYHQNTGGGLNGGVSYSGFYDTPEYLAVGDFNGDGLDDIVVTCYNYDTIGFLYQTQYGSMVRRPRINVGNYPQGIAVGDLTGNGADDIMFAVYYDQIISIFKNDPVGTIDGRHTIYGGDYPNRMEADDIDEDGIDDLIIAYEGDDEIGIFYGSTTIGSNTHDKIYVYDDPTDTAIGDFNNDGRKDIVTSSYGYYMYRVFQTGARTFGSYNSFSTYDYSKSAATGDLNNDGLDDVVIGISDDDRVNIFYQTSGGTFSSYDTYYTGWYPYDTACGDLNNDGLDDIVTANEGDSDISVLIQQSFGGFSRTDYSVGLYPYAVNIEDLNGDGLNDIVTASGGSNTISVYTQNSTTNLFENRMDYGTGSWPEELAIGDYNKDGLLDIATVSTSDEYLNIHYQTESFTFPFSESVYIYYGPRGVAMGDFNDDNWTDIAVTEYSYDTLNIFYGRPNVLTDFDLWHIPIGCNGPAQVGVGDLTEADGARPRLVSAITGGLEDGNSLNDTVIMAIFSEDLDGSTVNANGNDFNVTGSSIPVFAASEVLPGKVNLTVTPLAPDLKPKVKVVGTIKDPAGLGVELPAYVTAQDGISPQVTLATTNDLDADGHIDAYDLTFNENVTNLMNGTGFSLDGYTIDTANTTQTSMKSIRLGIIEKSSYDTGIEPNITYSSGNLTDLAGNNLLGVSDITEQDGAVPALPAFYISSVYETSPNLYSPNNGTLYYNNTASSPAPFQLRIEANDNGNLKNATGSDAFGNTSVVDTTNNTGGTAWEYELNYQVDQSETESQINVTVFDNDLNYGIDSIDLVLDNDPPITSLYTETGIVYVAPWTNIGLTSTDLSGVQISKYKIDSGAWMTYTGEFDLIGYSSGWHTVYYNSTDNVDNDEITKSTDLYIAEDWTGGVQSYGTHKNKAILANNLTISSNLTLINVTIFMNCTSNLIPVWINVTSTGIFNLTNCTIKSINPGYNYRFIVNGTMNMYDSEVEDLWGDVNNDKPGGIEIYKDTVNIQGSKIHNAMNNAIYIEGASPVINNTSIWNAERGIGAMDGADPTITNNMINNTNRAGIYLENCSSAVIDNNTLTDLNDKHGIIMNGMDLSGDVYITNNTLSNNIEYAIGLNNTQGTGNIHIKNNDVSYSDTAIYSGINNAGTLYISDNTIDMSTEGIMVNNDTSPVVTNNQLTNCFYGINLTYIFGNPQLSNNDLSSIGRVGMTLDYFNNFDVENNTFLNVGWEAIRTLNFNGALNVKNNDFNDCVWGGVWAYNNANSSAINILKNDFTNTWTPIYLEGNSDNVLIQENTLVGSIGDGIYIGKTSDDANDMVTIDNNQITGTIDDIWGNGDGIFIDTVNSILIKHNDIIDNDNNGISIKSDGWAWQSISIDNNLIKDNGDDGIYSTDSTFSPSGYVTNNTFLNNANYGFSSNYVINNWTFNGETTFSGNSIYMGSQDFDLTIGAGSNLILNDFNFRGDDFTIENNGTLTAYNSLFQNMADFNVYGSVELSSCDIDDADKVVLDDPEGVEFISTPIHNNDEYGIYITNTNLTLEDLTVYSNSGQGIYIVDASPTIQNSIIYSNTGGNMYLENFDGTISGNSMWSGNVYGISSYNSGGTITGNDIYSNQDGLLIDMCSNMVISNNFGIRNNWDDGIEITNSDSITISGNSLSWNSDNGIIITDSSFIVVGDSNTITSTGDVGIYLDSSNNITIKNNTINSNNNGDIGYYAYDSSALVENNNIWYHEQDGVKIVYSTGEIRYNDIGWNQGNGITKVIDQGTYIHDNYLHDNGDSPPNKAPGITGGYITPGTAYYNSVLTANTVGWSDPENAPEIPPIHQYQWQRNQSGFWVNIPGALNQNLGFGFVGGDEIRCVIAPNDGKDVGAPINTSSITISNSPPQITSVVLSPSVPYHTQPISTQINGFWDPDGDTTQVYYYAWYNQSGVIPGQTSSYLPADYTSPDDQIYCIVTPSDGTDSGTPVQSNTVIVILFVDPGSNPDSDGDGYSNAIDIFPNDPSEWFDNDYDGIGNNADTDDDNDGYSDANETAAGSNPLDFDSQPDDNDNDYIPDILDPDDDNDGFNDTSEIENSTNPLDPLSYPGSPNQPPSIDSVKILPETPYDNQVLTAIPQGFSDPDGDPTQVYYYQWYKNSVKISGATTQTLAPTNFVKNDIIYCEVMPSDGEDNGSNVTSLSVIILEFLGQGIDDYDGDGVVDAQDAFPYDPTQWTDTDGDGLGDNQTGTNPDPDIDNDGVLNGPDAFPYNNNEWNDTDWDGIGDNSDPDIDGDTVLNGADAFPYDNTEWSDTDEDGIGDNTDGDIDGDNVVNGLDAFPYNNNEWNDTDSDNIGDNSDPDIDGDNVLNGADAFPFDNSEWDDTDNDGIGDNTDPDIDGDTVPNANDDFPYDPTEYLDSDSDGFGNNIDQDDDNDGVIDVNDAFPYDATQWADYDGDGLGDNQTGNNPDPDMDNDGVVNGVDKFPKNGNEWNDTDNDNIGDNSDLDIDGDGVLNGADSFPYDNTEWSDYDMDGVGNNGDPDDDNDGYTDADENTAGSNPLDFNSKPADFDGDYIPDIIDSDDDNDGYTDAAENSAGTDPLDPNSYPGAPNQPPSITSVQLSPSPPYDNQPIIATPLGFSDPDGDTTQVYYYQWFNQTGKITGVTSSILVPSYFKAGDLIYVIVTPSDGKDNGTNVTSPTVLVILYVDPGSEPDDYDGDGVIDASDDFPYDSTQWSDFDGDGLGDNQGGNTPDPDIDNDGVLNQFDQFDYNSNEWDDTDTDGIGDNSDPDIDGDGVLNGADAFPYDNSEWDDTDNDGIGDNIDPDIDDDSVLNADDEFPFDKDEWNDTDTDGIGDNSDPDIDGDGVLNGADAFPYDSSEWIDSDSDGIGDNFDNDDDNDGTNDTSDDFPLDPTEDTDTDGDGKGDNSDWDIDNDGVANNDDAFPTDKDEWADTDNDGIGDNTDTDSDNDGVDDVNDKFPTDPKEWQDTDGDGTGDNSDLDLDGDGWSNDIEKAAGSNPFEKEDTPNDQDDDGTPDIYDNDIDGDGIPNNEDDFPTDATETKDTDGDGTGDNEDTDDDGDGIPDVDDDFPKNPNEWDDTDGDGMGDNADPDDDGDGVNDGDDDFPTDPDKDTDTDGDGVDDDEDTDDDDDGVDDTEDDFPNDPDESEDTDDDGHGDNNDQDIDGDGVLNVADEFPYDNTEWKDTDNDGTGDNTDTNRDGDGFPNSEDEFPDNPDEWTDTDSDGVGDNSDIDIDGDGVLNSADAFPFDGTKYKDTDGDGIDDEEDNDDDGDGIPDDEDNQPYVPQLDEQVTEKQVTDDTLITLIVVLAVILVIMIVVLMYTSRKGGSAALEASEEESEPDNELTQKLKARREGNSDSPSRPKARKR
jgi:parallel beta-helix repeat protein